ncbi:TetR/AcrR family transcriptional regulator [Nocardioides marinquilinus]|uniref:TetR/AcrR family transcriptional regulator n=1 Tax=Nocardioides marinquilinus TaxID=1210400 RepID=A0ABP9PEK2_9ACTN
MRRALLDAAAHEFARRGIDGASVDDVAAAAGFTKGAVYSHFGSKDGLVDALVEDRTTAYLEAGLTAVDGLEGALDVRARALGDRLSAVGTEQGDWHLLFFELWQRAVRAAEPGGVLGRQRDALRAAVADAISEHAESAGATLPLPAADLALVVMALTNGLAVERLVGPDDVAPDLMGRVLALLVQQPGDASRS